MKSLLFLSLLVILKINSLSAQDTIKLPPPQNLGGMPVMDVLRERHSIREYSDKKVSMEILSDLLWAADGYNRPVEKKRTAPSSMNYQEIEIFLALESGFYKYDAEKNCLLRILKEDIRALTGTQEFVKTAPINLVYIANYTKIKKPLSDYQLKASYANTGFIAENAFLYCTSVGLGSVIRASFNEKELSEKIKLNPDQKIILCQTVGYSKK